MRRRTLYTREQWEAAQASWSAGEPWSDEWKPWRHLAAEAAGIIDAPEGSRWDQWEDEHPSQRAILIRAIRETPDTLRRAIAMPGVRTWGDVIGRLIAGVEGFRADRASERHADPYKDTQRQDRAALQGIQTILGDMAAHGLTAAQVAAARMKRGS